VALTITIVDNIVEGNKRVITADVKFDNSYVAGGLPVIPATLGLTNILYVGLNSKANNLIQYDYVNKKLQAYVSSTGAEVAAAVDLSAVTVRARFIGN
jgi:hypothetical protein